MTLLFHATRVKKSQHRSGEALRCSPLPFRISSCSSRPSPEMPSKSSLTQEEKAKVSAAVPSSSNKIIVAVPARIYFAHPQQDKWSYGGLQGALAFTNDKSKDAFFLKLVDFAGTRGVIWHHELYAQFEYHKDRPLFHSFAGDVSSAFDQGIMTQTYTPRTAWLALSSPKRKTQLCSTRKSQLAKRRKPPRFLRS